MKMKSTKKRNRIKVISSKRLNLSSSRSLSSRKTSNISGIHKHKITALLKNNKSLALALQDARSELSMKQKLLENTTKHFKNIMQARALMSEMHSDLTSFMKKFDDALSLLNVNDIKISDLVVPFQSCNQFKQKMKKLAESVEELSEENSFSVMTETVNYDINMTESPNHIISCDQNSSVDSKGVEETKASIDTETTNFEAEDCQPLDICLENTRTFNAAMPDVISTKSSAEICKNFGETVNLPVEEPISPTKNDALKDRESSGTPRLSIPSINTPRLSILSINTLSSSKVLPNFKSCLPLKVPSTSDKIITNVSNLQVSSSKVKISKIPRFHDKSVPSKLKSHLSGNVCKQSDISLQRSLNISENSDLTIARRKTFVVKNDTLATISESNNTSDRNEVRNDDDFTTEELKQKCCRKTFVIKNLDIPKTEVESISERRKTFVKKPTDNNKIRKSVKNRRGTFVISDTKENCTNNEIVTTVAEISTSNDPIKDKCVLSEQILSEELPIVSEETSKITKNTLQQSLNDINVSSSSKFIFPKSQSKEITSVDEDIVTQTNKTILKQAEFELENNCKENLYTAENVNIKLSTFKSKESSDVDVISEKCVQSVMSDNEVEIIDINDNKCYSRSKKRVSYKMFLESSDSDSEIIPDLDLSLIKQSPPVKRIPIRRRISGSKKKKVFVFSADKRKSVLSKKSLTKVKKSIKQPDVVQEYHQISPTGSTGNENKEVITELSKCQGNEKMMKCLSSDSASNMPSNNICSSEDYETSNNKQEIQQSSATGLKNAEIPKSVNFEKLSVSKSSENDVIKNSLSLFNSPVIASHKFLNVIECEREDIDCGDTQDNMVCKTKTKSKKEHIKTSKKTKVKSDIIKDSSVDVLSVTKCTKKNKSKKQIKQVTSGVQEINNSNTALPNQNEEKETKRNNKNKSRKIRKKPPTNVSNGNTLVVQAEVHSPPQEYFTTSRTCFDKENKSRPENENCLVLLKDIFMPTNIDILSLSKNNSSNIPLKVPLSDNLHNIITSVGDSHDVKNEENIANDNQGARHSKRIRKVNYVEPSLRKKLRQ